MSNFPELPFGPGEYACRWFFEDRTCSGEVDLHGNRLPSFNILEENWAPRAGETVVYSFGESLEFPRVIGKLRSNHDIVLIDASIARALPGWSLGQARLAIVGLGVDRVDEDRYEEILLQVTGADQFFSV